jgi:hypothetical protein
LTIRLDGQEDQEVTLPRSYLDGRGRGERNRRVDLAYATTGQRALEAEAAELEERWCELTERIGCRRIG